MDNAENVIEETQNTKRGFPRFIQNKPRGVDLFEGNSQERLATAIASHIENIDASQESDNIPRIIGLQGNWGSGKSNVIKLLNAKIDQKYHFFEYDAWGHQEDLQRRSILELFTGNLLEKCILTGNTSVTRKDGTEETVSWKERLNYLLARKTISVTKKYPKFNPIVIIVLIISLLSPIFAIIADKCLPEFTQNDGWLYFLPVIVGSFPLIAGLVIWFFAYLIDENFSLKYFLAIYNDKVEDDICYETFSEEEPSIAEFVNWMKDISDHIENAKTKKVVIVFDNMDRLPVDKVKELWSSIYSFFAGDGFKNIWVIIPFDEKHLGKAFNENDIPGNEGNIKYFLDKTFPVVYRVTPPIISDHKKIFKDLFEEAFGSSESDQDEINRIFRLIKPNSTVREIISFINEIVALKQEFGNMVSLKAMSVFVLTREKIYNAPDKEILSGEYLSGIKTIISNSTEWQTEISSLVYGVEKERAQEIPLTQYIKECIDEAEGHDINSFANTNDHFDTVLNEVMINEDLSKFNKTVLCLSKLMKSNDQIVNIWDTLVKNIDSLVFEKQEFSEEYKSFLLHSTKKQLIVNDLFERLYNFEKNSGNAYYTALTEIRRFIKENNLECELKEEKIKNVNSEEYTEYLRAAKENYKTCRVCVSPNDYISYLADKTNEDTFDYSDIVCILNEDKSFDFQPLKQSIEEFIEKDLVTEKNVKKIFGSYKLISKDGVLEKKLSQARIQEINKNMESQGKNEPNTGYADILAMCFCNNLNVTIKDERLVSEVASVMDYYGTFYEFLIKSVTQTIPSLLSVLKYMIEQKIGKEMSFLKVLPMYIQIRDKIGVSDKDFLLCLSKWESDSISISTFPTFFPKIEIFSIFPKNADIKFVEAVTGIASEIIRSISWNDLYQSRTNYKTDYNHALINCLIDCQKLQKAPENIREFVKQLLNDIAQGTQSFPLGNYYEKLINITEESELSPRIVEIQNKFLNQEIEMNKDKFLFFEKWIRVYGHLKSRKEDVYILLSPVINNEECRKLIIENQKFYVPLINSAGDAANDFKNKIKELSLSEPENNELRKFADDLKIAFNTEN